MPKSIPDRAPLGDPFTGVVLRTETGDALALTAHDGASVVASGSFVIRYGAHFLGIGKTHLSIVPGLIVLDYGDFLTGEEAWEFLVRRSNLYPRSEVVGYRSDGKDDMVFIRQLDLGQPIAVLVYPDATATLPIAQPTGLIAPNADSAALPARLLQYLPRFPSLEAWREGIPS